MMDAIQIVENFKVEHCVTNACPKSAPRLAKMLERWGGRGLVLVDGKVHSLVGFTDEEKRKIVDAPAESGKVLLLADGTVARISIEEVAE